MTAHEAIAAMKAELERLGIEYKKESVFRTVRNETAKEVISKIGNFLDTLEADEQPKRTINFMAGHKGNLPLGTRTMWHEVEATQEKLVLKNELTGEVVVEKTIPEHMRGADPEIACACTKLLSAGWTLIAPGVEGVDLEKELSGWMGYYAYENGGEYPSAIDIARHFFNLGLNSKK